MTAVLLVGLVGCGGSAGTVPAGESNTPAPPAKETITLTKANISQYLNIRDTDFYLSSSYKMGSTYLRWGDATVETTPLKQGTFENVKIKVALEKPEQGWPRHEVEFTLPFDGRWEETVEVKSTVYTEYVSANPDFDITVVSVTGTFVKD